MTALFLKEIFHVQQCTGVSCIIDTGKLPDKIKFHHSFEVSRNIHECFLVYIELSFLGQYGVVYDVKQYRP